MGTALLERNALAEALSREVARMAEQRVMRTFAGGYPEACEQIKEALEAAHAAFAVACPTQAAFAQKRALERLQGIK